MLQAVSGLVPTRFLTLISHFVLTLTVLMSREDNVMACLPIEFNQMEYDRKDTELATGLGVTIGLLAIEMVSLDLDIERAYCLQNYSRNLVRNLQQLC